MWEPPSTLSPSSSSSSFSSSEEEDHQLFPFALPEPSLLDFAHLRQKDWVDEGFATGRGPLYRCGGGCERGGGTLCMCVGCGCLGDDAVQMRVVSYVHGGGGHCMVRGLVRHPSHLPHFHMQGLDPGVG